MKNVVLSKEWYEELLKSGWDDEDIDMIFGRITRAIFCDEEPDLEGLDKGIKSTINGYYGQALRMANNKEEKSQTANNRAGKSKYNANYIYVLAKIGLKQSECMSILGYPNLNAIKDSAGWKATRNAEHPDLAQLEASFAATVDEMEREIPDLRARLKKLKLKFNPWEQKVEKVEKNQLFNKKVEIELQPKAEKVEKVELNQPTFNSTSSTFTMDFNDF